MNHKRRQFLQTTLAAAALTQFNQALDAITIEGLRLPQAILDFSEVA